MVFRENAYGISSSSFFVPCEKGSGTERQPLLRQEKVPLWIRGIMRAALSDAKTIQLKISTFSHSIPAFSKTHT